MKRGLMRSLPPDLREFGAAGGGSDTVSLRQGEPPMTKKTNLGTERSAANSLPTKSQQVIDLLRRGGGATLEEMATLASWLPHSTRAFMTGLRKKGYVIESTKTGGTRCYHIVSAGGA